MFQFLQNILDYVNGRFIWGPYLMIPLLLGTGLFLTLRMKLIQVRRFGHAVGIAAGLYDNPDDEGEISHFQALCAALSATIGIGNIAGVAIAIHLGGPGAVFWMWITALVGMATKFTSCMLSHRFRVIHEDGSSSGGPMYYIEKGMGKGFKWLAVWFALCTSIAALGIGNMVQSNSAAQGLEGDLHIPLWVTGLVLSVLLWMVIVGGIKRIGTVASKLVPLMSLIYIIGALVIIFVNVEELPGAFRSIFTGAFLPAPAAGGFLGASFFLVLRWGVARGIFSNESGLGSAPIAHAAAKTEEPVREGLVAMLGPFIDTILICSMTAIVIITTGAWHDKYEREFDMADTLVVEKSAENLDYRSETVPFTGVVRAADGIITDEGLQFIRNEGTVEEPLVSLDEKPFTGEIKVADGAVVRGDLNMTGKVLLNGTELTSAAFDVGLPGGKLLVTLGILLFAFSTAISWSYYGDRCIRYLFGPSFIMPYRWVFVFFHFVGALVTLDLVWAFADAANGLMAIPNIIALLFLSGTAAAMTKKYFSRKHERVK